MEPESVQPSVALSKEFEEFSVEHHREWASQWRFTDTAGRKYKRNVWRHLNDKEVQFAISKNGEDNSTLCFASIEDLDTLLLLLWHPRRYAWGNWYAVSTVPYNLRSDIRFRRMSKSGQIKMHHLIHPELPMIDHINRNSMDNRRCNLRRTTAKENANNRKKQTNNTTGVNGVCHEANIFCYTALYSTQGRQRSKRFAYGHRSSRSQRTKEQAFQEAVAWRLAKDVETGCTNGYDVV